MKKIKKTLSLILALVLVLSLIPAGTVVAAVERVLSILVEPMLVFQNAYPFSNGRSIVYLSNGKTAIVNTRGEIVVALDYHEARYHSDYLLRVGLGSNWVEPVNDGVYEIPGHWSSWKYGIVDMNGNVAVPVIYDYINRVSDDLLIVGIRASSGYMKVGVVDTTGNEVIPLIYDSIGVFNDGIARVCIAEGRGEYGRLINPKYGYVDTAGNVVVPIIYDDIGDFSDGFARVGEGEGRNAQGSLINAKYGFVDATGKVVIPIIYDNAGFFSEGLASVTVAEGRDSTGILINPKTGFINTSGDVVIDFKYDTAEHFTDGAARVGVGNRGPGGSLSNTKWGLINTDGDVVIPLEYDTFDRYPDGLARVGIGTNWQTRKFGIIDQTGNIVIPIIYDDISSFSEGLARVGMGASGSRKFGFINASNEVVVPIKYDDAFSFNGGLARVGVGERTEWGGLDNAKWGFVDTSGNEVVPLIYDYIWIFSDGLISVSVRNESMTKYGVIDKTGNVVVPVIYNSVGLFSEGIFSVGVGADWETMKYGLINTAGDIILPIEYDRMPWGFNPDEEVFWIQKDGLFGIARYREPQPWRLPESINKFDDVPNDSWKNEGVSWAEQNGITTGTSATTFSPDDPVTRAQFVTFFHRIYGKPSAPRAAFIDMPGNVDFQNAISWALAVRITTGTPAGGNTFMPDANITREQIAAMLYRYIGGGVPVLENKLGGYTDSHMISPWAGAEDAVNWAVFHGIMGRNVTELNPRGNATRAEAVTMLHRVVEIFDISAPAP